MADRDANAGDLMRNLTCLGVATFFLSVPACTGGAAGGDSTQWHLEEHALKSTAATEVSVIADCRGNNSLSWQVLTERGELPPPAKVGVFCKMVASKPQRGLKNAWGWRKKNWPDSDPCTYESRGRHGEDDCDDYFRAERADVSVSAPWCELSFKWSKPTNVDTVVVTYCVTK